MSDVQYEENYPDPAAVDEAIADATATADAGEIDGTSDAAAETDSSEEQWGYEGKKKKLTKEVIVGFSAIALLVTLGAVMVGKTLFGGGEPEPQQIAENDPEDNTGGADNEETPPDPEEPVVVDTEIPGAVPGTSGQFYPPAVPSDPADIEPPIGDPGFGGGEPEIVSAVPSEVGIVHPAAVEPSVERATTDELFGPRDPNESTSISPPGRNMVDVGERDPLDRDRPVGLLDQRPRWNEMGTSGPGPMPTGPESSVAADVPAYNPPGLSDPSPGVSGMREPDPFAAERSVSELPAETALDGIPGPGFESGPGIGGAEPVPTVGVVEPVPGVGIADVAIEPVPGGAGIGSNDYPGPGGLPVVEPDFPSTADDRNDWGAPAVSPAPQQTGITGLPVGSYPNESLPGGLASEPVQPEITTPPIGALPVNSTYEQPVVVGAEPEPGFDPSPLNPPAGVGEYQPPIVAADTGALPPAMDTFEPLGPTETIGSPAGIGLPEASFPTVSSTIPGGQYTVARGDSFWTISKKIYGTGRYWQKLAEHNKGVVPNPDRMKPGVVLSTPDPTVFGGPVAATSLSQPGGLVSTVETTGRIDSYGPVTTVEPAASNGFFTDVQQGSPMYRVGRQDTLISIAAKHLGRSSRWRQIYNMNRAELQNPNKLQVGMVLKLPADASRVPLIARAASGR